MAMPVYLWLTDDAGKLVKGSVDVDGRDGFIIHGDSSRHLGKRCCLKMIILKTTTPTPQRVLRQNTQTQMLTASMMFSLLQAWQTLMNVQCASMDI